MFSWIKNIAAAVYNKARALVQSIIERFRKIKQVLEAIWTQLRWYIKFRRAGMSHNMALGVMGVVMHRTLPTLPVRIGTTIISLED